MRASRWIGLSVGLLILAALVAAYSKPAPPGLCVLFNGEQDGYLDPCGCTKPMIGGVSRLGGYVAVSGRRSALLLLENGDVVDGVGRQDQMKAETLFEMWNALHYDAFCPGEDDFKLGLPFLNALQVRFQGAFVCANIRKTTGRPLYGECVVVQRSAGANAPPALVVGLVSEQFRDAVVGSGPGVVVEPPEVALGRLRQRIEGFHGVRVLLFHGPLDEARDLAESFPWFQLVIYAHHGDGPTVMEHVGNTVLACSGQDGKFIGRVDFGPAQQGIRGAGYTSLGPEIAQDARILAIKRAYLDRVSAEDLLGKAPRMALPVGDGYVGAAACKKCHAGAFRTWAASRHSHALATLATAKEDVDPECVICHAVGMDRAGGFRGELVTPGLAGVQCENCHGPGLRHSRELGAAKMKSDDMVCLECHTPLQSPHFSFATHWLLIRH